MEYVKGIAFFMVFSGILLELISETKYQKFGEWVVGILLILQIIKPFIDEEKIWEQFMYQLSSFDYVMEDSIADRIILGEDLVSDSVRINYEDKLREQISNLLKKNSLLLQKAVFELSESSGEIKKISIWAGYQTMEDTQTDGIMIAEIPPVVIGDETENMPTPDVMTPLEIYIKNLLSDFYNLSADNINVSIQEES